MTWRVRVQDDPGFDRVRVAIVRPFGEGRSEVVTSLTPWETRVVNEAEAPSWQEMPVIPAEVARPLVEAMLQHLGGSFDTRTLRGDLLHERGRVDTLIGALITVATSPPVTVEEARGTGAFR